MFLLLFCFLALCSTGEAQPFKWVIQNIYRQPQKCEPQDLISINAWRADLCVKADDTRWQKRTCNDEQITSQYFSDSACSPSSSLNGQQFPANACGATSSTQGVFFACETRDTPPTLSNQNNDVFNDLTYLPSSNPCASSQIYQSLSYIGNNVCVLGEERNCLSCTGTSCAQYTVKNCGASTPGPSNTGVCGNKTIGSLPTSPKFEFTTQCLAAVAATPTPADPENPPGTNPNTLAKCSDATTIDQCLGQATVNGELTLPITGLISKCCVWCSGPNGASSCSEPGFSSKTCECPLNTTAPADLARIYSCPSGQQQNFGCACAGRPFGAATCANSEGGITNAASSLASAASMLVLSMLLACLL